MASKEVYYTSKPASLVQTTFTQWHFTTVNETIFLTIVITKVNINRKYVEDKNVCKFYATTVL